MAEIMGIAANRPVPRPPGMSMPYYESAAALNSMLWLSVMAPFTLTDLKYICTYIY